MPEARACSTPRSPRVRPWEILGESRTSDGNAISLTRRGRDYLILVDGKPLMGSDMKGSEQALASYACARAKELEEPCVLVGGLGMGFTLRAAVDLMPPRGRVIVSELIEAVVEWNRGELGALAARPMDDRRVSVDVGDVGALLRRSPGKFDAVMLDVDNGPTAFTQSANQSLYGNAGILAARASLKPGGVFAVWSAWEDRKFEHRLRYHGFAVEVHRVRARLKSGGPRHTIFVGSLEDKTGARSPLRGAKSKVTTETS